MGADPENSVAGGFNCSVSHVDDHSVVDHLPSERLAVLKIELSVLRTSTNVNLYKVLIIEVIYLPVMKEFDPYDPIDPLNQNYNDPLYPDTGPDPFDPMFQDDLRIASDQVLRRAKEQAQFENPTVRSEIQQELWNRQAMRTEPPDPQEVTTTVEETSNSYNLSDEEKAALTLHILSTTVIPLEMVDGNDYGHKCKYCDEEVRPIAEGPQHESGCQRHSPYLKYDADASHKYKCAHCDARPFVAGFHHRPDCPRGFPAITPWEVQRGDYKHECDCGVRPISEGPHHSSSCEHHAEIPLFHTERAHEYYCTHCEARPFAAGPHHKEDCQRHIDEIAIPVGFLSDES